MGISARICRRCSFAVPAFVAGATLATAAPVSATVLPPTADPLPGSAFRGANGLQDDIAPLVDWRSVQTAGRVDHNPDPNEADSAFEGGSEEDKPIGWALTTERGGVSPAKDNILDAWSVVDQPGAETFVYLGFTRQAAEGTTFLTFELNRDDRLWDNGRARIPCRRTGDVLVSYEAHGDEVEVAIQRWVTDRVNNLTGCAETGHLDEFTRFQPNVDGQGAMNAGAIASRLPGFYGGTVPAGRFGEAALNLTRLLEEAFGDDCLAFSSIWMHSRSSASEASNMQDYVAPERLTVRTCAASGTKFFDREANGRRDPGDPGIPRFLIFADYDDDGVRDRNEPFTVSDNQGEYVLYDIRPPDGTYMLRETLLTRRSRTTPVAEDWQCSYPNAGTIGGTGSGPNGRFGCAWGPIDVNATPYATGRDFGNWFPARLTLEKELDPPGDSGRFDLLVDGQVVLPAAGDGASITLSVPPGEYDVSEMASPGTDPADYSTRVECRRTPRRRGVRRAGTAFENLALLAGQRATCTFRNTLVGTLGGPSIAITKTGPATAEAGETLGYTLFVTNPGDASFPEAGVQVTDPECDDPPALAGKRDASGEDGSPGTLDPGDTWIYRCSNTTVDAGADCEPTRIDNAATVVGTAPGASVSDEDSISTVILCPDQPSPPVPVPVGPPGAGEPGAVVPRGPRPPNAGDAGIAALLFRRATQGCISSRVPRIPLELTRISRLRVFVNGRLVRRLTVRTLQSRVRPRVTLPPGRYRLAVRVTFQRGSGTPPLTLRGSFRICGRPSGSPRVTG